jgi:ribosomal-protein-serine acetyltransferase
VSPLPVDLGDGAILRRLVLNDLEDLWAVVERERERIGAWMPWVALTPTIDDERTWLESVCANERSLEGSGVFVDGRYVGAVGLMPGPYGITAEIGYFIDAEHEGRGLVTRAVQALVDIGFGEMGVNRIVIRSGVDNARSRAIPERLGFVFEGVERGGGQGTDGYHDLNVYSMLRSEWLRGELRRR